MTESDDQLATLRAELDALDHELLALARRRLEVVARIKEAKRARGKPLFDRSREQEVYRRAERNAADVGLDPRLARDLMRQLVEASHRLQEEPVDEATSEHHAFLLVGGRGQMGTRLGRAFAERGHSVDVLDRGDLLDPDRVAAADIVMVCVPMGLAARAIEALAPLVREDALLCDINSLKVDVCRALATSRGEALGTHPMFGPTVASLRRQKVVVCEVRPGPRGRWLVAELGRMGVEIVQTTPAHHDAMMGVVQVLTHFGIIAMGRALLATGHSLPETLAFTSPIYRLELAMVGRLFSQQPELYRAIMRQNPHGALVRETFLREARSLAERLADDDETGFVDAFLDVRTYFADYSDEAMALSDHIIETIMARP